MPHSSTTLVLGNLLLFPMMAHRLISAWSPASVEAWRTVEFAVQGLSQVRRSIRFSIELAIKKERRLKMFDEHDESDWTNERTDGQTGWSIAVAGSGWRNV